MIENPRSNQSIVKVNATHAIPAWRTRASAWHTLPTAVLSFAYPARVYELNQRTRKQPQSTQSKLGYSMHRVLVGHQHHAQRKCRTTNHDLHTRIAMLVVSRIMHLRMHVENLRTETDMSNHRQRREHCINRMHLFVSTASSDQSHSFPVRSNESRH